MERLAAPAHLHDTSTGASSTSVPAPVWSTTLPHQHSRLHATVHQHHYQYQVQQHARSRSNSGRDALLNTSTDSAVAAASSWCSPSAPSAPSNASSSAHDLSAASYQHPSPQHCSGYTPTPSAAPLNTSFSSSSNLNTSFGGVSTASSLGGTCNKNTTAPPLVNHPSAGMEHKKEVKLNSVEWFHSKISREEAEALLQPREDGLFLVRESTNFPGDYTLCVCYQSKVEHYRVIAKDSQLTIDEEEYFDHLTKLVKHYEQDADGLCTQLVRALPKQGSAEKAFKEAGWVINRNDIQVGDTIGKGEFGNVLLGDWLGRKVAVKRLKDNCTAAKQLLDEASLMTSLTHDNLVDLLGLVFEESSILLVTEYMSKGNLVDYLRSRGRLHVTKRDQIMFACDTAAGMAYLESCAVVHRDLAARNVLISHENVAKVCDFGLAKTSIAKIDSVKFPIKWTAPEALRNNKFSNKSDMWSFGILLWEIYSFGRVPYPKIPLADVMKYVEKGYRMDAPDNCPPEVFTMMDEAWRLDPNERPNFEEVLQRLTVIKQATPA